MLAGCASGGTSSRFVRRAGDGPIDLGGPPPAPVDTEAVERAKREALARRAAEPRTKLPSIEGRDKGLREALAELGRRETAAAHVAVGYEYERVGVRDAAFDHYSDAVRLDSRNATAWDRRARLWRDWNIVALALSDVHRARYFAPNSPEVHNTLGTILELAGNCAGALASYRHAVQLAPDAPWARANVERLASRCDTVAASAAGPAPQPR